MEKTKGRDIFANAVFKCPNCKKEMVIFNRGDYVFKQKIKGKTHYFCSYSCLQKYRKDHNLIIDISQDYI